ncbi:MAG: response regulator transcription factor [Actinobacteria bacterium]|nr:response regulator transcription factor [Actinomycetota bacterium]
MIKLEIPQILLVDDHPSVRSGIKRAIESAGMACCGEAASRSEAFAQIAHKSPDGVILDLNLPDGSGFDIVQWIRKHSKEMAIVVLTMSDDEAHLIAAMRAGASAFVKKSAPLEDVVSSLRSALSQPKNFSAAGLGSALKKTEAADVLTPRELTVLHALSLPGTNSQLAKSLYISEATFKTHLAAIYRKLKVGNRLGAVMKAQSLNQI